MADPVPAIYTEEFFDSHEQGAVNSARVVVPILMDLLTPSSVIDVGCGRGAWLRVFQENGVATTQGLDGPYVSQSKLLIDPACFTPIDLNGSFQIRDQYDLAVCLEVVEHLRPSAGQSLIHNLTSVAPVVLFSAAIPGQGGRNHVNEQWPSYWRAIFAKYGFRMLDPIRRHVWHDVRVRWWYRQNMFLYASSEAMEKWPALQWEEKLVPAVEVEWVHVNILNRWIHPKGKKSILSRLLRRTAARVRLWS